MPIGHLPVSSFDGGKTILPQRKRMTRQSSVHQMGRLPSARSAKMPMNANEPRIVQMAFIMLTEFE